ncbi:hypothetical protein Tco_0484856 [Tanacetum coccineum]
MKRKGKGFSRRVTPLFQTMMVQAQEEVGEGSANPTNPHHTPTIIQPLTSQPQKKQNLRNPMRKDTKEDASKQGRRIHDIDADKDITLENVHDVDMFGINDLDGDEVFVETKEPVVNAATTISIILVSAAKDLSDVDMTLAQALAELKNVKPKVATTAVTRPKAKGLVIQEQEQASTPIVSSSQSSQDKVETDYELAQRLQAEEQEELTINEKSKLFQQLLEKRRKHFAAKRAEERRNRPPTKAQQRIIMCTYLKNMAGWKPKDLKTKSFANVQELFDKAMKRVNTFVDMDTELVGGSEVRAEGSKTKEESSSKRTGEELESDKSKKQKLDEKVEAEVDDAKEAEELKQCLEIVPDDGDDVTIDATPLSVKIPIVDYKIYQEGKKSFFKIIRADGKTQMYLTFTKMLKNFDREDLEVLWRIVKARFKKTEPVNYMDTFLHLNLKTMFEHHVEDSIWKNQQGLVKVLNWKLFYSCGVHCVTVQTIPYYLLVEKMYPLTKHTLHQMFNNVKLQVDYECEMAFDLLRLVKKQLKEGYGRIVGIKRLLSAVEVTAAGYDFYCCKTLKNFDREDFEVLWRIVKARLKKTKPVDYMDIFLHLNLKTMFEHHVEDSIWNNQQGLVKVLNWKLFDSCGVHCVTVQSIPYYLLVEKMYPLTKHTLHQMFNNVKLQFDYECEMAFDLPILVKKQLKEGYVPE